MHTEFYIFLGFLLAYLLGSIPTAVWFGKYFYGIDVRKHGSGNAGATNTFRVLGVKAGIIVFIVDFMKGIGTIAMTGLFRSFFYLDEYFVVYQLMLGVLAMLGHMLPVFAKFNGGKGVAVLAGIVLALFPEVFLVCLGIFMTVLLPTRYVSLSSISAAIAFPVFVIFVFKTDLLSKVIFSLLTAVILLLTHRKNIHRLIKGTEKKIIF